MSNKDKKATRAALRDFLVAVPGTFDRVGKALYWLVVLSAVAMVAIAAVVVFWPRHPPEAPPGGNGDNPAATLFVRDLGRLPDSRHTFDLVYELVLANQTRRPFRIESSDDRIMLGTLAVHGDVVRLDPAPREFGETRSGADQGIIWSAPLKSVHRTGGLEGEYPPGRSRVHVAHYRVNARPDQFAAIEIAFAFGRKSNDQPGPSRDADPQKPDGRAEEVQFGAVLRAHCPLGVKIHNGEVRSLCAS